MARRAMTEIRKSSKEASRIIDALFLALEGSPRYDAMTETVSDEHARISAEETNPVIIAEFFALSLRSIAREFGVAV